MADQTETVSLTINGNTVETAPGRLLIDVAEEHNVFVPRFCYHPGLESVAACRMCLVEIEGSRRPLDPACATPVAEGMVVHTNSENAVEAQESVLEMLLINHPLDCPICDQGGECPLQDQALKFGPGRSRYIEEKRHFKKPLPISDLVVLDRERCVLCWRCVRFCDEVSGDRFIDLMDRGSLTQINTAPEKPFDSYFSGNTIQMCPVGALTSFSSRFTTRPWDLSTSSTTCSYCAVGCPISLEHRAGEVLRGQALPNEEVNSFWNCDKGRFGHRYVSNPERLRTPLVLKQGAEKKFEPASWDAALDLVSGQLRAVLESKGPKGVGFIGGSHATNEDLFAVSRFFREVVGTPNVDFRTFDSGYSYQAAGFAGSTAQMSDLDDADTIVWIGPDPKEELPVLYLRVRRAVQQGAKLLVVHPRRISLCDIGNHLRPRPGREAEAVSAIRGDGDGGLPAEVLSEARAMLGEKAVVCCGPQFIGGKSRVPSAASALAKSAGAKLLLCVPNANSQGAIDMGLLPGLAAGHAEAPEGLDTRGMLEAAAAGDIEFLWITGADLFSDFPGAELVSGALYSGAFVVVSELFATDTARAATVVLPAASVAEKEGSYTNLERRIQKVNPAVPPPGAARADWQIMREMAARLGQQWPWASSADVAKEIANLPTHSGFDWAELAEPPRPVRQSGDAPEAGAAWPFTWELRAVDATRRRGWVWERNSGVTQSQPAGGAKAPTTDASYPLMLLSSRVLYDGGQMSNRSPELRVLTADSYVELHPDEAKTRRLSEGAEVTVVSGAGSIRVPLRVSDSTPRGAAFVPFQVPGLNANVLMSGEGPWFVEVSS